MVNKVKVDNIPQGLKEKRCWFLWGYKHVEGTKLNKQPLKINGLPGSKNDPTQYSSYEEVLNTYEKGNFEGIGIVVPDDIVVVDIDHCIENGIPNTYSLKIIEHFGTYTELSPSITGIHLFFKCKGFEIDKDKYKTNNRSRIQHNDNTGTEIYTSSTPSFITVTGYTMNGFGYEKEKYQEIREVSKDEIIWFLDNYMKREQEETKVNTIKFKGKCEQTIEQVINEGCNHQYFGDKFKQLFYEGSTGDRSHSEDDICLCGYLCRLTDGNEEMIDEIFRKSSLYRQKWDEVHYGDGSTYGQRTIETSINNYLKYKNNNKTEGDTKMETKNNIENERKYVIPMNDNVVKDIEVDEKELLYERICKIDPINNEKYELWSDLSNSKLFSEVYVDKTTYVPEKKEFYVYDGKRWINDVDNVITKRFMEDLSEVIEKYLNNVVSKFKEENPLISPISIEKYCDKIIGKWSDQRNRKRYLEDVKSQLFTSINEFDKDKDLLNVKNGTIYLHDDGTFEFKKHNPKDKVTKMMNVEFKPGLTCNRWDTFISEIMCSNQEKSKFLQKIVGYGISGKTQYECCFLFYGETTRNGKSTLVESVNNIMGDYSTNSDVETIGKKRTNDSSGPSENLAVLKGKRFVVVSELPTNFVLDVGVVKRMTGNDTITCRYLRGHQFTYRPNFKIYINTNYLPSVRDDSLFKSDRVHVITFDRHFKDEERDTTLKSKFEEEDSKSGILNWLLEGYRMICEEGLKVPECVKHSTNQYQESQDRVDQFLQECCEIGSVDEYEVKPKDMYRLYTQWCYDCNYSPLGYENFMKSMKDKGYITVKRRPKSQDVDILTNGNPTNLFVGIRQKIEYTSRSYNQIQSYKIYKN